MKILNHNASKNVAYTLFACMLLFSLMTFTSCESDNFDSEESYVDNDLKLSSNSVNLSINSASASTEQSGNPASNAIDANYSTRWSAYGTSVTLDLTLGSISTVDYLNISFYKRDIRTNTFQIYTKESLNDAWVLVGSKTSTKTTAEYETFDVTNSLGKYVRLLCNGNSQTEWNSILEVQIWGTNGDDTGSHGEFTYPLLATGQEIAYDLDGLVITGLTESDDLYGQDAHYLKGIAPSYQDNGDETVNDLITGLMWQQVPTTANFTWSDAEAYCDSLVLGGYDDWRMPNIKELFSISDFSTGWPYIDTNYFNLASGENSKDEQFWSSNLYVGVTQEGGNYAAFGVNHVTGHIKAYSASAGGPVGGKYVRAVRGEQYGINDFVENGDSTITDKSTGLMWAQDDSGEGLEWSSALVYAKNSELAGYDDWRIPNIREIQSVVDYTRSITATDESNVGPAIDDLFNCTMITSEAGYDDYSYYWSSTSAYFSPASPEYYYAWYVAIGRAVNSEGEDFHGAGAVRFDTKYSGGVDGEDAERYYNYVFLVRDAK